MRKVNRLFLLFVFLFIAGCAGKTKATQNIGTEKVKEPSLKEAINDLTKQAAEKGGTKLKVCIGQNTYRDTNIGSEFSAFISEELSREIIKSGAFEEISRKHLDQILKEQELSLTGLIDPSETIEPGKIKGVDAILTGTYWEEGKDIKINLSLIRVVSAEKLGAVSFLLSENEIPKGIELRPQNYDDYLLLTKIWGENKGTSKDLKIKIWVDKGKGGVYKKDENVTIYFIANKNCHIRLYHTNTEGEMQLLFPNLYSKGDYIQGEKLYTIPDERMAFEFKVVPPFGAEIINAVASVQPFPVEDSDNFKDQVFLPQGKATEKNIRSMISRGISVVPVDARIEDRCVFTTIKGSK